MNGSRKWKSWLACMPAALIATTAPAIAVDFDLSALNGPVSEELAPDYVSGTIRPIGYGVVNNDQILTLRAGTPVICARRGYLSASKYMIVDPNGYFQDTSVQYSPPSDMPMTMNLLLKPNTPFVSWIRGSDGVRFGEATFVAGGQTPLFFVSDVNAQCVALPEIDTAPGVSTCQGAVDAPERIFGNQFEAPSGNGTLSMSSRVVSSDIAWLTYEHILTAQGGPISALSLREQFAHASLEGGQPVFKHSLGMASSWNCQASEGATCGVDVRTGLGYIRLDGINLQANTCIRITATRPRRSDGVENVPFSGRLFTAAFYQRSVGLDYVNDTVTTRIKYAQ